MSGFKDNLGVPREGVWVVSLCLTKVSLWISLSEGIINWKMFEAKLRNFSAIMKEFIVQ